MKKIIFLLLLISTNVWASPPTRQYSYTPNSVISSSEVSANENSIFNYLQAGVDAIADGTILNADISSIANIQSDKLNLTSINQNISNVGTLTNTGNVTVTGNETVSGTLSVTSNVTANGVTYSTLPAGVIMGWTTTTPPSGWLICDGTAVSRTTYAGLFAVIGTTFGAGDASTTFNLPDLRGRNIIGYKTTDTNFDTMGETGGESLHTMTLAELVAHTHTIDRYTNGAGANGVSTGVGDTTDVQTGSAGSSTPFNVLDPYISLPYIIKY